MGTFSEKEVEHFLSKLEQAYNSVHKEHGDFNIAKLKYEHVVPAELRHLITRDVFQKFVEKRMKISNIDSSDDDSETLEDEIREEEEEELEKEKKRQLQLKNISSEIIQKMLKKREETAAKMKRARENNPEKSAPEEDASEETEEQPEVSKPENIMKM